MHAYEFRPPPLSAASILEGFELIRVFWKIATGPDRKKALDLAKRLSTGDAKSGR
jgi:hypothetical protein